MSAPGLLTDSHGRVMRDLRVSVTDRCNFRCLYCLPETEEAANFYRTKFDAIKNPNPPAPIALKWKPREDLLTFEEIVRLVRIFTSLGIEKIRLTGGEPLLRKGIDELVQSVAAVPGVRDLALTTNGFRFLPMADRLKAVGLHRVNFSLDSLDRENFKKMTGCDGLMEVLAGVKKAKQLGMHPVKVNAVIIRGINDHEVERLAEWAMEMSITLRFIEFMPLDSKRSWQKDLVVTGREMLKQLQARFKLEAVENGNVSETARRWRLSGSDAEIGMISPVSEPFCGHCNRLRLTADGKLRTCLFSIGEHDVKGLFRDGFKDEDIIEWLTKVTLQKEKRHRIGEVDFVQPERSMSCIGG